MDRLKPYSYRLPLKAPYSIREGIVIEWPDGTWTEASPWEGWSSDCLEDIISAFLNKASSSHSSLQFALEPLPLKMISIPYCAFVAGTKSDILRTAAELKEQGIDHLKIKLTLVTFEEALEITNHLSKDFRLRLDFNRTLDLQKAIDFASRCAIDRIEYFEEPLKDSQALCDFPYPIALDESLREKNYETLTKLPQVVALVIKPTMSGGLTACRNWERFGKPLVLGGSFESGIGIAQIALIAAHLQGPLLPLGIDTYRFLEDDLLEEPLHFERGLVHLPASFAIKRHLLQPL